MKRITITVTDGDERRLRAEAAARRVSISELVRTKLDRADSCECEQPKLAFIGIGRSKPPYDRMSFSEMRELIGKKLLAELDQ